MSQAQNAMDDDQAKNLDRQFGTDRFVYIYAHAAKKRGNEDHAGLMNELRHSLLAFERRRQQAELTAALAFTFDPDLEPEESPKPETEIKTEKNKGNNKVNNFKKSFSHEYLPLKRNPFKIRTPANL